MANLFTTILNMSLTACIIILIVLLARQCLKKVPKIFSYVLWSVVLFRLLCPVSISLPVSILAPMSEASTSAGTSYTAAMEYISLPERNESEQTQQAVSGENGTQGNTIGTEEELSTAPVITPTSPETVSPPVVVEQKMSAGEIVLTILGWVWVAGMAGVLGMTAWQTIALKRRLADACIVRGNIFESDKIDTAFILGVINPKIYLPLGLPFDVQKAVVAHEQTHQRRGDHIVKFVSYIVLAIHWFNPLVWFSFKLMCSDMEKSCDEAVIQTFNNRGYTEKSVKKSYSEMLFALGSGKKHLFSPVSFAEHSTKERIINVTKFKHISTIFSIMLGVVCIAIIGICIINPSNASAAYSNIDGADVQSYSNSSDSLKINDVTFTNEIIELDLSNQAVTDISCLANCENLEYLNLSNTGITDISILSKLPALRRLDLSDNCTLVYDEEQKRKILCSSIQDWSQLSELKSLTELNLSNTGFTDASYLSNLKMLKMLDLSYNSELVDISPLASLKSLEFLGLNGNTHDYYNANNSLIIHGYLSEITDLKLVGNIADISCVVNFPNLKTLLIADQTKISDFSCLSERKNLQVLDASGCNLTDISFAAKIPLKELALSGCPIKNYSPLTMCNSLTALDLSNTYIADISLLSSLNNLIKLDLSDNLGSLPGNPPALVQIIQTEHLSEMESLEELYLRNIRISDISSLCNLVNLKVLDISWNQISDISILAKMTKLEVLDVSNNIPLRDATAISGMQNLKELNISCTSITEDKFPQNLPSITKLYIEETWEIQHTLSLEGYNGLKVLVVNNPNVWEVTGLSDMKNLEYLDITNVAVVSIPGLSNASALAEVHLSYADEETISTLSTLNNLRYLSIDNCNADIQKLANLSNLESLEIKTTEISDFSALGNLTSLKKLVINSDGLTDISFVSSLKNLEYLSFGGSSELSNISPLASIPQLKFLSLSSCGVEDISVLSSLENLENLYLSNNKISDATALYSLQDAALNREESYCDIVGNNLTNEQIIELNEKLSRCTIFPTEDDLTEEELLNQ